MQRLPTLRTVIAKCWNQQYESVNEILLDVKKGAVFNSQHKPRLMVFISSFPLAAERKRCIRPPSDSRHCGCNYSAHFVVDKIIEIPVKALDCAPKYESDGSKYVWDRRGPDGTGTGSPRRAQPDGVRSRISLWLHVPPSLSLLLPLPPIPSLSPSPLQPSFLFPYPSFLTFPPSIPVLPVS